MSQHAPQREVMVSTEDLVDQLLDGYAAGTGVMEHVGAYELPSMTEVDRIVEEVRALMFPGFVGAGLVRATPAELRDYVRERVEDLRRTLRRQLYRGLHHRSQLERGTKDLDCPDCAARANDITERFFARAVEIRNLLALDVAAHYEGDPAATGTDEVIFCYPGLYAITVYRVAHVLLAEGAQIIPRMMTELAHRRTGIDIHPGAVIGASFLIDHGTGIVIGETSVIGQRVRMYQGVTLGALSVPRGHSRPAHGVRRHPVIEDDVIIYSGATILGGQTVIGAGAVIGGNCWVTSSVPPGARLTINGLQRSG
jgi:serine O-acetyltransferase